MVVVSRWKENLIVLVDCGVGCPCCNPLCAAIPRSSSLEGRWSVHWVHLVPFDVWHSSVMPLTGSFIFSGVGRTELYQRSGSVSCSFQRRKTWGCQWRCQRLASLLLRIFASSLRLLSRRYVWLTLAPVVYHFVYVATECPFSIALWGRGRLGWSKISLLLQYGQRHPQWLWLLHFTRSITFCYHARNSEGIPNALSRAVSLASWCISLKSSLPSLSTSWVSCLC